MLILTTTLLSTDAEIDEAEALVETENKIAAVSINRDIFNATILSNKKIFCAEIIVAVYENNLDFALSR